MNVLPTTLKRLIASSVLSMILAIIGATFAIIEKRPANAGSLSTALPLIQDFLYGNGTAMSPLLYMLVAQAILTVVRLRSTNDGLTTVVRYVPEVSPGEYLRVWS